MDGNTDEIWKQIPGYEGRYEASSHGRIRSVDHMSKGRWGIARRHSRVLSQNDVHNGYKQVKFSIDGKKSQPLVHRLVALTFIPNPEHLPQVNHKDGNTSNNCVENLEWCTASENAKHRCHALKHFGGRCARKVLCIDTGIVYKNSKQASEALGIDIYNIYRVCGGHGRTAGGYRLEYIMN